MIVNTSLLSGLARSVALVSPQSGDSDVVVPSTLLPVKEIPEVWQDSPQPVFGTNTIAEAITSGFAGTQGTLAPAAGLSQTRFCSLAGGVWRVKIYFNCLLPAVVTTFIIRASFIGTATAVDFLRAYNTGAIRELIGQFEYEVTSPGRGQNHIVMVQMNNTGGATDMSANISVHYNRYIG